MFNKLFSFVIIIYSLLSFPIATGAEKSTGTFILAGLSYNQVPVLCYHNITISPAKEDLLWISKVHFDQQMKMLYDSGYHTISPEELYQHLTKGTSLPSKPVIISLDDAHKEHFSIAFSVLNKYHFKGVFFVITAGIGKKHSLSAEEIKSLSDSGHTIGCHTYNHPAVTAIHKKDWFLQIDSSKKALEKITGKQVEYFAYPYGIWSNAAVGELKKSGFKSAFQLTGKASETEPLFTLRRMMVSGAWSPGELQVKVQKRFAG